MPGKKHEVWFYERFVSGDFQVNRAEDWERLRVMDGNTLKPAMGQGFKGTPSSAQIEKLYQMVMEGKLVYFELADSQPFIVNTNEKHRIDLNPVKPTEPAPLGKVYTNMQKASHDDQVARYNARMRIYEQNMKALNQLGEAFQGAVERYNSSRNMGAEKTELNVRAGSRGDLMYLRRLENTDRFINETFGPRPIASPEFFYEQKGDHGDFVFKYSEFEQLFEPNGYDLPENSRLTAQEVATINFAMTGSREFVEKQFKEKVNMGPVHAKSSSTNGFQMLLTGCFAKQRVNQVLSGDGILDATFKLGKETVEQYNKGNAELLGQHLAASVRNIKTVCTGYGIQAVSADFVSGARVIGRIQELFDKHEDIKLAANLTEKELEFMRGYVQMGKAYEQYLKSMIKLSNATVRAEAQRAKEKEAAASAEAQPAKDKNKRKETKVKALTVNEKTEILADAVLRKLVEKELAADLEARFAEPDFKKGYLEAKARDAEDSRALQAWQQENPDKMGTPAQYKFVQDNDMGLHSTAYGTQDQDHEIIHTMARKGMLEKMRRDLMQNPAILAAAAKDPLEFNTSELEKSEKLDALTAQAEATKNSWETSEADKRAWFESIKTMLSGNKPENWLNPKADLDNNRLMIGYMRYDAEKGTNEVNLVGLEAIFEGGVKALENPTQETLDILHEHAAKGNLYYYDVGKDMPIRVGAEGAQATKEQVKGPTLWQTFANWITRGWAYAEIFNPTPDNPAAAIMSARASRSAVAQNEAQQRKQQIAQAEKDFEQREELKQEKDQKKEEEKEEDFSQMVGRQLAEHNKEKVDAAIARFADVKEKYLPAADKNTMGLTNEEVGVLAAISSGSRELSFVSTKNGVTKTFENNPDEYYSKIISTRYAEGGEIQPKTAKLFHALAIKEVKESLENGDMSKLGKMIADGLTQNNKWLAKQTDLTDYYTVYAELGSKLLNIVEKHEPLKQAFEKHLGKNKDQIKMAKAAKNISDLRIKVLPIKDRLVREHKAYEDACKRGVTNARRPVSSNEEIATIGQLCSIQHHMKLGIFKLEKTPYDHPGRVDQVNNKLKANEHLKNFHTRTGHIEVVLDSVPAMAILFEDARKSIKEGPAKNQNQVQKTLNQQNETQKEMSKGGRLV